MTHCAKCGTELIGSRKFCAACGAPAGDPRSPAASTGLAPVMSGRVPGAPGSAPGSNPGSSPSIQYAPAPASQVNPFAQTAGPVTNRQKAPDYGPPPPPSIPPELGSTTKGVGDPAGAPQVSPLAVSNVNSSRGAFENAVTSGPASTAAVAAGLVGVITHPENDPSQSGVKRSPVAGTQMMPSVANPAAASASAAGGAPSKRQDRTQMLGAFPPGTVPRPGAPAPAAPASAPAGVSPVAASTSAPSAGSLPVADPQRVSSVPHVPSAAAYAPPPQPQPMQPPPPPPLAQPPQQTAPMQPQPMQPQPMQPQPMQPPAQPPPAWSPAAAPYGNPQPPPQAMPYAQPAPYAQPPMAPPQPMAAPPPPYGFGGGFAYVPGSRVTVTWSNGGRYPGTVQQVSGTQCLVMFPDGQQHWVEMQYVAPA